MIASVALLASLTSALRRWGATSTSGTYSLVLFGILLLVVLAVFFCAVAFNRAFRQHRHSPSPRVYPGPPGKAKPKRRRRASERRRHEEPPLNPTRAETGGLPPVRSDEEPPTPTA